MDKHSKQEKMKTIKVRPLLLPTNYVGATLTLYHDGKGKYPQLSTDLNKLQYHTNQELILISLDEKIEEGDTYCYFEKNTWNIRECLKKEEQYFEKQYKLIATQEQLSPELIQQLITDYNNGGMRDFEIEMMYRECPNSTIENWNYFPEPLLTNGFVTVVKKKSDNFISFLKERIDKDSSTETKVAYTIVLEQYKKEILYTEEEVLNMLDKYDEAKWGCPARKGMEEITFWFNKNKKK